MIQDAQLAFSDAQAITATAVSTNSYDTVNSQDVGNGTNLHAVATVNTAFNNLTSIQASLVEADDAALTSNVTILAAGPVVVLAGATKGALLMDTIIPGSNQRYIGFKYTVVGTAPTAGKVDASIVWNTDTGRYYTAQTGF